MKYEHTSNLVALFDPSVKHRLIESYGLNCYTETKEGLRFKIGFDDRSYMVRWLLGFGGNVKVLEPADVAKNYRMPQKTF